MKPHHDPIRLPQYPLPVWIAYGCLGIALALVPWIGVLSVVLPSHHVFRHWDVAWVGFDAALVGLFFGTGLLVYRRSRWAAMSSVALSVMLVMDAWFDVLSAAPGRPLVVAVATAVILELPLAVGLLVVAGRTLGGPRPDGVKR